MDKLVRLRELCEIFSRWKDPRGYGKATGDPRAHYVCIYLYSPFLEFLGGRVLSGPVFTVTDEIVRNGIDGGVFIHAGYYGTEEDLVGPL